MRGFQAPTSDSRGIQISLILLGITTATGLAVAQGALTVSGLIEIIQEISTGTDLLSNISILAASGGALGTGIGIILGSGALYRRKRAQIEEKLS
jgi:hypothetical protein